MDPHASRLRHPLAIFLHAKIPSILRRPPFHRNLAMFSHYIVSSVRKVKFATLGCHFGRHLKQENTAFRRKQGKPQLPIKRSIF
jgi:hypothetical protein